MALGEAVSEALAGRQAARARARSRLAVAFAVQRASLEPRRQRILRITIRGSSHTNHGWRRGMDHDLACRRAREYDRGVEGNPIPALFRAALLCVCLLHRLQSEFGR